jgi:4-hydroxybenzoate polyprenyltransferase
VGSGDFPLRRGFERLVGPRLMPYLLHLRPLEWPIMSAHFLLGSLIACGWPLPGRASLLGWFIFVVLLNGGTLAINSVFDQDEGDIGYLKAPPKPPPYLLQVSSLMLAAALGLGFLLPRVFAWSNAACVVMSVLYSVPPVRLKARAGWDLLINMVGFGALTPLAGWGISARPLPPWFIGVAVGFALLFGALYPATQIYQIEEDRARGDRTLVIRAGETASLWGAILLAVLAHACFAWSLFAFGREGLLHWLIPSLSGWLAVLIPWCLVWRKMTQKQHEAGMYWTLAAWAVTDLSLLLLFWPR